MDAKTLKDAKATIKECSAKLKSTSAKLRAGGKPQEADYCRDFAQALDEMESTLS